MQLYTISFHISYWKERVLFFIFLKPKTAVLKPSLFFLAAPTSTSPLYLLFFLTYSTLYVYCYFLKLFWA